MARPGVVAAAAIGVAALAFGLRLLEATALATTSADTMVPALVAAAFLCAAGLARRSAPAVVGFSLGFAALLGAIEAIAVIRGWLPATPAVDRPLLVALAGLAGTAATLVAWRFLEVQLGGDWIRARRSLIVVVVVGLVAFAFANAVATASAEPVAVRPDQLTPLRLATRIALALATAALVVGAALVVLPRLAGSWRRATGRGGVGWGQALVDAFLPALALRRRTVETERARLAADLHALVIPELRHAVRATSGADPAVAARVRSALDEVELLMTSRQSPILEAFGLVAALEWLAERTQERAGVVVGLEVDPATTNERPPLHVERAAFRAAMLAVDNAVRHALGSAIDMGVLVERGRISLRIDDDGTGMSAEAPGLPAADHRGLADLRTEAEAVGAQVDIGSRQGQAGTSVAFDWPA